nr:hypothetical protein GCM10025732_37680 [Glycomyces mayteni]
MPQTGVGDRSAAYRTVRPDGPTRLQERADTGTMVAGQLTTSVAGMCEELAGKVSSASRPVVEEVASRLGQPLRVAVAGRLKAGKSTLVNALIGRRVAPTAAGECTRVVTQFRYGPADRVDVVARNGVKHAVPLDANGMIPTSLPIPADEAAMIDVQLSSDRLRDLTVVDTPGLQSVNTDISEAAREMLFAAPIAEDVDDDSKAAVESAEAIIYVFTQQVRADDVEALEAFSKASQQLSSSPMNALGLYNKADKLAPGPGQDPGPSRARSPGTRRTCCAAPCATSSPSWACSPRPPRPGS